MWRIKNDVVFIITLVRHGGAKGTAALGTSASKLYRLLDLLILTMEVALSQDAQPADPSLLQSLRFLPAGQSDAGICSDIDNPLNTSAHLQHSYSHFNQDSIRDNFSAMTLLVDQVLDGIGCPGGAVPNLLISSPESENYLVTEMLKKAVSSNVAQDMIQGSTQNARSQYWVMRSAVVQMAEESD